MRFELLDHGYLSLVDSWGSDEAIICAARMSTAKGFLGWGPKDEGPCEVCGNFSHNCAACGYTGRKIVPGDEKLLRYLWEHDHWTPFEMAGLTVEVKAPIMTFREWHRHRVPFGYNEMSARYVPLPDENYSPTVERIVQGSRKTANRQAASVAGEIAPIDAEAWLDELAKAYEHAERVYRLGLSLGVPKELARLPVPVGRYSRMRATGNLRGWLGFLRLRHAPQAQHEIRVYAEAIAGIIAEKFPRTHALYAEGRA